MMTDEKLKKILSQIGIEKYFNAIKKLQFEYQLDDDVIEQLATHDYSSIIAKYAYFKKSWINAYNQVKKGSFDEKKNDIDDGQNSVEKSLCNFLCDNGILSTFEVKNMQSILSQKIKEYSFDLFIVAFDYSAIKVLRIISSLHNPTAYFMTALDSNLKKVTSMYINQNDVLALKNKYGLE